MRSVLFAGVGLAACSAQGLNTDPSRGELGRAELAWDSGVLGCLFGCDASAPMAERAYATLMVANAEDLPPFTVESEDPAVAEFESSGGAAIDVWSHAPGRVKVILRDAGGGEVIDRFAIDVRPVHEILVERPEHVERVMVMAGGDVIMDVSLTDEDGELMVGVGGVDYALAGGLTEAQVGLAEAVAEIYVDLLIGGRESLDLKVGEIGEGSVRISAPSGVVLDLPFAVVGPEVVRAVTVDAPDGLDVGWSSAFHAYAWASADEPVHSPECAWELVPVEGDIELDFTTRDTLWVIANTTGSAIARCTLNGAVGEDTVIVVESP
jgi:hypothetical protein